MTKGAIVIPSRPTRKWVDIFRAWADSNYIVLILHCSDYKQCKRVQASAMHFRTRNNLLFWSRVDGSDVYLIKMDALKKYAVETQVDREGLVHFQIREDIDAERKLYNKGLIE